jgi:hypothetical protein
LKGCCAHGRQYRLQFNGIDVGRLEMTSSTDG